MAYYLKSITASYSVIQRGRENVGYARTQKDGKWRAEIGNAKTEGHATSADAFHEVTAIANRIALCGENDRAKAADALAKRNAEVLKQRDEMNALFGDSLQKLGIRYRTRKRRIHI